MKQPKQDPHEHVFKMLHDDLGTLLAHRLHAKFGKKPASPEAPESAAAEKKEPQGPASSPDEMSEADRSALAEHYSKLGK